MQTKHCARCDTVQPVDAFAADNSRKDGKHPTCKSCLRAYNQRTKLQRATQKAVAYRANPEPAKARANRRRLAKPDAVAATKAAAFMALSDEIKSARFASLRDWKRNNPGKVAANTRARQAAKLNATPPWANMEKVAGFYDAAVLVSNALGVEHHVDHIVPLRGKTVCGLHNEFNLQILTADANLKKLNRIWPDQP